MVVSSQSVIAAWSEVWWIQEFAFLLKKDFLSGGARTYAAQENHCQKKLPHGALPNQAIYC